MTSDQMIDEVGDDFQAAAQRDANEGDRTRHRCRLWGAVPCRAGVVPFLQGAVLCRADVVPFLQGAVPCRVDVVPFLWGAVLCRAGVVLFLWGVVPNYFYIPAVYTPAFSVFTAVNGA